MELNKELKQFVNIYLDSCPEDSEWFADEFEAALSNIELMNWDPELASIRAKILDPVSTLTSGESDRLDKIFHMAAVSQRTRRMSNLDKIQAFIEYIERDEDDDSFNVRKVKEAFYAFRQSRLSTNGPVARELS